VVYTVGRVARDCHVKSGKALYSVPWRLVGQHATVRTAGDVVQIFHDDTVVATHVLHLSGRSTNFEHYPPHKIAHTLRSVTWCRTQAEQVGPGAVAIVAELSVVNAIHRLRAIQGIIRLRDTYGDDRLDTECARALQVGDRATAPSKASWSPAPNTATTDSADTSRHRRRCCAVLMRSTPSAPPDPLLPDPVLPQPLRIMDFVMAIHDPSLRAALKRLKLTGMLDTLDARLAQTRDGKLGHLEFLQMLCEDEIARRVRRARFPNNPTPSRTSTSPSARNYPPRCCATWPRCAGSKPASQ
jgi:hypothetical protein